MRASARPAKARAQGERLGRYDLLAPIASGGMATVYLARTRGIGGFERDVAIKLMHPHLREHREFEVDLIEEAKLCARIRHPNVVPVLDVSSDRFGVYLVMEYIEGTSLSGLCKTTHGPLPAGIALCVLLDTLSGLHAAHELEDEAGRPLGLVHRDVSPQNVLVGLDGISRLTDFGIARAATRISHTRTGTTKGKLAYMSPEQANAQPLDRRCDVWAAGVVAWELVAGRRLFSGTEASIVLDVISGRVPSLRSLRPELPEGIAAAIESALEVRLSARCPSAAALRDRILDACCGEWVPAGAALVGDYVESVVGDALTKRRLRAREVALARGPLGEPPVDAAELPLTAADPVWLAPTEDIELLAQPVTSSRVEPVTLPAGPGSQLTRRAWPLVALGVVIAGLAAFGIANALSGEPAERAAEAAAPPSLAATSAPAPAASTPATATNESPIELAPPPETSASAPPPSAAKSSVRRPSASGRGSKPFKNPY